MWMSLVAMKVWMRGKAAGWMALAHASMSPFVARASPQMMGGFSWLPTTCAMLFTAAQSSLDAMGKPASMTSTPSLASCLATCIFSSLVIEQPGLCSPSLSVVSKTLTRVGSRPVARSCAVGTTHTGLGPAIMVVGAVWRRAERRGEREKPARGAEERPAAVVRDAGRREMRGEGAKPEKAAVEASVAAKTATRAALVAPMLGELLWKRGIGRKGAALLLPMSGRLRVLRAV
mmetsp:Transcript_28009/g.70625  ORF Transcript_28009/g.70625 Transcript_28009/m.70625 type:complete len:232 (+) Transcript_28009:1483-2178(+)